MCLKLFLAFICLLLCSCLSGPDSETVRYKNKIVLDFEVANIIDNECIFGEISLIPYESSPECFYLVETPDHLDSVFLDISYLYTWTPRLDEFFPSQGMLLVYFRYISSEDCYNEHSVSFNGDTVFIDVSIEEFEVNNPSPGLNGVVIPIGIIPAID